MKNLIKLLGLIALAAVIVLSMAACPADAGDSGGGGGGGVPYKVTWEPEPGNKGMLQIIFGVGSGGDNRQKVADARQITDIEMSPSDGVLTYDSVYSSSTRDYWRIKYNVVNGGTVKITLKPIAGCTFTKDPSGSDTITVTYTPPSP
jgi:hypothetical protein